MIEKGEEKQKKKVVFERSLVEQLSVLLMRKRGIPEGSYIDELLPGAKDSYGCINPYISRDFF